jgi:DNA-binding transcriptional MerR regulator
MAGRGRKSVRTRNTGKVLISRSAFCAMVGVSERQLMIWEHEDLLVPAQLLESSGTRQPLYDHAALERARLIRTLEQELEVNLPGIGIILNLLERLGR